MPVVLNNERCKGCGKYFSDRYDGILYCTRCLSKLDSWMAIPPNGPQVKRELQQLAKEVAA